MEEKISPLLGIVGNQNKGTMGLELQWDDLLSGNPTSKKILRDAHMQKILLEPQVSLPQRPGNDLVLTIDRALQEIAYEELELGVKNAAALGGSLLMMDPNTGKILAAANFPTFNPHYTENLKLENAKNQVFQDIFEPGSVMKPFVIAWALEQHAISKNEKIYCEKGEMKIGRRSIQDVHPHEFLSPEEIMVESSNIGTYKIASKLGRENLYHGIKFFGIGEPLNDQELDFPGKTSSVVSHFSKWDESRFANIAFGYGFFASPIEMVAAMAVIANGGQLVKPHIVEKVESPIGKLIYGASVDIRRQVISLNISSLMKNYLEKSVVDGTGKKAFSNIYRTAGKTGTTEKIDPQTKAYSNEKHRASFLGFAPFDDPSLVVYVVIDEPKNKPYFGGQWAAPIFRRVMERSLNYLNVPSDQIEKNLLDIAKTKNGVPLDEKL